jgi:cysteine desulfurase / selenocysteine lyase|tara:strand:- start:16002 stop:17222 length:1221 start_codon:yes stop_codon:yes gene_type:complete
MIKSLNVDSIRKKFPILKTKINGNDLVYFDNAATTQKPSQVINSLDFYYKNYNANIHRGIHSLAEKATEEFEKTRHIVKDFINAKSEKEIIFTRGTTEGINLVATCYSKRFLKENDEIIISEMEHHSNIVPWQMICDEKKLKLKTIRVNKNGELDINNFKNLISNKTKFVSLVHISNSLGTINPIKKIINICKEFGIKILIDGAQASPHINIDVQELDCDFYVLSAHKMYGPTGIGVIYGKTKILNEIPPYMGGGEMIKDVTFNKTSYNEIPYKFEAGTPNIGDVIAFKEAIIFINDTGKEIIHNYENKIKDYTLKKLQSIDGLKLFGNAKSRIGVFSFTIKKLHYYDLGLLLDAKGIAIRTGHHCTQPIMDKFKLEGTARISLAIYNSIEEIDYFIDSLNKIIRK